MKIMGLIKIKILLNIFYFLDFFLFLFFRLFFGFYLICDGESDEIWSCDVSSVTLTIVSKNNEDKFLEFSEKTNIFTGCSLGNKKFISFEVILLL